MSDHNMNFWTCKEESISTTQCIKMSMLQYAEKIQVLSKKDYTVGTRMKKLNLIFAEYRPWCKSCNQSLWITASVSKTEQKNTSSEIQSSWRKWANGTFFSCIKGLFSSALCVGFNWPEADKILRSKIYCQNGNFLWKDWLFWAASQNLKPSMGPVSEQLSVFLLHLCWTLSW